MGAHGRRVDAFCRIAKGTELGVHTVQIFLSSNGHFLIVIMTSGNTRAEKKN